MSEKSAKARTYIEGLLVAEMIMDFQREFNGTYPTELMRCEMMAVGPMQTFLGNAIAKGFLPPSDHKGQ